MVQWFSPSGLVLCQLVTLSCKLNIFSPTSCHCHGLLHFLSAYPRVQMLQSSSGFSSFPHTSYPTMATSPPGNLLFSGIPVHPSGEAQPPAWSLQGAECTSESSGLDEVCDESFPQQTLNYSACSCLLLSSNC